jgi:hypothetical protein
MVVVLIMVILFKTINPDLLEIDLTILNEIQTSAPSSGISSDPNNPPLQSPPVDPVIENIPTECTDEFCSE